MHASERSAVAEASISSCIKLANYSYIYIALQQYSRVN